jgi:hypothetical protein
LYIREKGIPCSRELVLESYVVRKSVFLQAR